MLDPKCFALKFISQANNSTPKINVTRDILVFEYYKPLTPSKDEMGGASHGFKVLIKEGFIHEDENGYLSLTDKGKQELSNLSEIC
ncbi:hypothetical protein [Neisseria dumasiana]|uniref:Uncharacterized protein n=1 Tax=Neisseria dumasiana TaxID=1931275 RepID=A0ABX3WLC0_9NEIS|nr:hypothetical protein [Neisseria dumasiana]OSI34708.1 hypothetical protein BV913_06735 [Neisseria dumasiana]UOO85479.1 hypothetical protein LVJ88_05805 [Neisseria dumasiana]